MRESLKYAIRGGRGFRALFPAGVGERWTVQVRKRLAARGERAYLVVVTLRHSALQRARRARDPRFDGRFFVGVVTTRVYCRPVCPAPTPREENVRYFPTAAAAAEAGFRPCLRCRPETSPGTPAWAGSSATVSRALRLIAESTLDESSVEQLAGRLGIGARQLRRLFTRHVGASPVAVAQTRRLHFAKRLIDETDLPLTEVALSSGFGSIRRFNAVFKALYRRAPRDLRRLRRRATDHLAADRYIFRLAFRPPLDWDALLGFLSQRAIPGVEEVRDGRYLRTIALDGRVGEIEAELMNGCVVLRVRFPDPHALFSIVERVRRLFDLGADPMEIGAHLRRDPLLAQRVKRRPGLRVPGAWDGFELAVRAILGQQISVRAAATLAGRLIQKLGKAVPGKGGLTHVFPTPQILAEASLSSSGLTRARAEALHALARACADGTLRFDAAEDVEQSVARLKRLPGVGDWTAQYVAMRALGEPDAFPAGDLALMRAAGFASPQDLERRADRWRPWRAYAALHLWQGVKDDALDMLRRDRKPGGRPAPRRR
jgi:AraC family transcriptional regulator, regulatory protein of adaptative response / DNA-3-methyladenine glycosylase II